jgi:hypothetical protein
MNSYRDVLGKVKTKQETYKYAINKLELLKSEKDKLTASLSLKEQSEALLNNIVFACKLILEKLTYNSKAKLENFLTYALQNIFTDRKYEIKLIMRDDTKRPALELTLVEDGIEQQITDAVGGGILSTLGLLLQIYYIEVYNLNKIMFIDEGLKEISTGSLNMLGHNELTVNYLNNVVAFLKWLATERGYAFVIVTHDNQVRSLADRVYEVNKGEVLLC